MTAILLPTMRFAIDWRDEDAAPATAEKGRLAAMVADHFELIWRTLARICVPSADLADCVQQVFVVASRRLSSIAIGSERSFLIGTAIHVERDARRTLGAVRSELRVIVESDAAAALEWTSRGDAPGGGELVYSGVSVLEFVREKLRRFQAYFDPRALGRELEVPDARRAGLTPADRG